MYIYMYMYLNLFCIPVKLNNSPFKKSKPLFVKLMIPFALWASPLTHCLNFQMIRSEILGCHTPVL